MTATDIHSKIQGLVKRAFQEKQARNKELDSILDNVKDVSKPTSTGIRAGLGLGSILAAAGAIARSGDDSRKSSILTNPLLLGALGTVGGYLGGNAFDRIKTVEKKEKPGLAVPGLLGAGGILQLGKDVAKKDIEKKDAQILKNYTILRRKYTSPNGTLRIPSGAKADEFYKAQDALKKILIRDGRYDALSNIIPGSKVTKAEKILSHIFDSANSPIRQLQALNPLKNINVSKSKNILDATSKGSKQIFYQLRNVLGLSPNKIKNITDATVAIPRLKALAALTGAGWLGINGIRRLASKDE